MIPDNAADLANAPILGLLAIIVLVLLSLLYLAIKLVVDQGKGTSDTLKEQVSRLQGRLDEMTRRLDVMSDRAIRAEIEVGNLKTKLDDAERDRDDAVTKMRSMERKLDRAIKRVHLLEELMRKANIAIPDEDAEAA